MTEPWQRCPSPSQRQPDDQTGTENQQQHEHGLSKLIAGQAPPRPIAQADAQIDRYQTGDRLLASAVESGDLVLGEALDPRALDAMQMHQVRKKRALSTRYETLAAAGKPTIRTVGLRVDELGAELAVSVRRREADGTRRRIEAGRYSEERS